MESEGQPELEPVKTHVPVVSTASLEEFTSLLCHSCDGFSAGAALSFIVQVGFALTHGIILFLCLR